MNVGDFPRSDSGGERGTPDALHHSGCRYQASTVCPPSSSGRFFLPVGSGEHRNWGSPRGKPPASQCNRKVGENMGVGTLKKLRGLCLRGLAPRTWAVGGGRSLAHTSPTVTSRSRTPPGGGGAFPLCGPGAPGPAPPSAPFQRRWGRRRGPGAGLRGSVEPLPAPARPLPALPALLPRAARPSGRSRGCRQLSALPGR